MSGPEARGLADPQAGSRALPNAARSRSLELIRACGLDAHAPIIDVSGATPGWVDALLDAGFTDVTLLVPDVENLESLREHVGARRALVKLIAGELSEFHPQRRYALWHDAGTFHRLIHPEERQQYVELVQQALRPEGHLVLVTYGPHGPERYAGLPVCRYSSKTLPAELGGQFELTDHSLGSPSASQEILHCRFVRHAPKWPH